MAIFDLFSKRQSDAAKSGKSDVYQYADIPGGLRVQLGQIAIDAIGLVGAYGDGILSGNRENPQWVQIEQTFLREKGLDSIDSDSFAGNRVLKYMRKCSTSDWLDLVELISRGIFATNEQNIRYYHQQWQIRISMTSAIDEINYRFRQAGVGYQLEDGLLIRVDSQFVHSEIIRPALTLLSERGFEGPQQEFLQAHQHYRSGEYRQSVAMAANSLESTFKAIFDRKGWTYQKGARISDLVKVARAHSLWPDYLDASFDQLLATLQSGLPKIRDNDASHGQGAKAKEVPAYIAAYALHLAASKILFVTEAAK